MREHDADRCAQKTDERALRERLPDQTAARRTESGRERILPASFVEASQGQSGDIGAKREKHETDAPRDERHGSFLIRDTRRAGELRSHGGLVRR